MKFLKKVELAESELTTQKYDLVVNDKSKQALFNLKDLLKLNIDKLGFDLIRNLIVINFNVHQKIWTVSGAFNRLLSFVLPINSISQSILFSIVSNGLLFSWGTPIHFYSEYIVSKFPQKQPPSIWFLNSVTRLILKSISDSFKIFGFLMLAKFAQRLPIWQISLGFMIWLVIKASLVPLFFKYMFPGFLKPVPKGELRDELTKVCSQVNYNPDTIYLSEIFMGVGYNYLPNRVTINKRITDKFTPKEYSSRVLSAIYSIKLNSNLKQDLRQVAELYLNLVIFDSFLMNDNTILTQFGFLENQDGLLFIKYLLFNQIFIPLNLVILSLQRYFNKLSTQQIDEETFKIYKQDYINYLKKSTINSDLEFFENDCLYEFYYSKVPGTAKRIKHLTENIKTNNTNK
ncbi:hypothetical protein KGF54_001486 [Candida jiufengensis]|uniref:uncharacterized protein n=1 Tax=Candida jiufengensis TaxID=497108 RepID=UPI002225B653|nr:uncharacterized protein KGF54_001486 [Candida jiufengensis]KAI5954925.1 hypothetical protein KGF54_001486 [Candida jiufengensis]